MVESTYKCHRIDILCHRYFCHPPYLILQKVVYFETLSDKVFFVFSTSSGDPGAPPNDQKFPEMTKTPSSGPHFGTYS